MISWALARNVEIPSALLAALKANGAPIIDLQQAVIAVSEERDALRRQLDDLLQTEAEKPSDPAKALTNRGRKNLLLMIYAMAKHKYGFDPMRKNSAAKIISSLAIEEGGEASEDSVLRKLQEGADLVQG